MYILAILVGIVLSYIVFHAFAYFSILHFFAIKDSIFRIVILASFVFLAASFFISTFISRAQDTFFSKWYYFLSGSWIGFLTSLMLFFVLAWMATGIFSRANIAVDQKMIGIFAIFAAAVFSMYGTWNAFHPVVKKINASIGNLPSDWKGKKIVQISDVHLGHIYGPEFMKEAAQKINALNPEMIVITGDLFDGADGNLDVFIDSLKQMSAPRGIYYVTGNHETYLGIENTKEILDKTSIIWLQDEMRDLSGLQIVGINYPERFETKDIAEIIKNMPNFDRQKPSILLWHTPSQIEKIKNAGVSLQLSGHTHKGQIFPYGFITKLVYKGYDFGYKKEGTYSIHTTSGLGGWGPPTRTEKKSEIVEITLE